jgi:hypothetical protein
MNDGFTRNLMRRRDRLVENKGKMSEFDVNKKMGRAYSELFVENTTSPQKQVQRG